MAKIKLSPPTFATSILTELGGKRKEKMMSKRKVKAPEYSITHVHLHGTHGTRQLQIPNVQGMIERPTPESLDKEAAAVHRRKAFAIVVDLRPQLRLKGKSEEDLWNQIKAQYNVDSRAHLTAQHWAVVAARLETARINRTFLKRLLSGCPASTSFFEPRQKVQPQDTPLKRVTADPRKNFVSGAAENMRIYRISHLGDKDKRIYEASPREKDDAVFARAQAYANRTGYLVRIVRHDPHLLANFTPAVLREVPDMPPVVDPDASPSVRLEGMSKPRLRQKEGA